MFEVRELQWFRQRVAAPAFGSPQANASLDRLAMDIPACNMIRLAVRIKCAEGQNTAVPETDWPMGPPNPGQPGFEELEAAVAYAKSIGYKVSIRVGSLRGVTGLLFVPPDMNAWFANFRDAVLTWATYCESRGVDLFGIATELSLEVEAQNNLWSQLIADVRSIYSGEIYYNTNWWHTKALYAAKAASTWMGFLDRIGISSYPRLVPITQYPPRYETPSVADLVYRYHNYPIGDLMGEDYILGPYSYRALSIAHNTPILIITGLASVWGVYDHPWTGWDDPEPISFQHQVNWFEAAFQVLDQPWCAGMSIDAGWQTNPLKNPNNKEFILMGKPAAVTVQNWFNALSPTPISDFNLTAALAAGGLTFAATGNPLYSGVAALISGLITKKT